MLPHQYRRKFERLSKRSPRPQSPSVTLPLNKMPLSLHDLRCRDLVGHGAGCQPLSHAPVTHVPHVLSWPDLAGAR